MENKKTWLSILLYWLLAATLITALIAFRHIFMGLVFMKTMAFFIAVGSSFIVYLILLIRGEARLPRLNLLNAAMAVLLVALGVTTVFSIHPYVSFWGAYNRIFGLVTWLHIGAFFYILAGFLRDRKDWTRLLQISIWASLPVVLYGLGQYFNFSFLAPSETYRIESTIGNPVFLAGYLMILLPMTLAYAVTTKNVFYRWSFGIIGLLQIITLLLTGSRGALVALAITILILLIVYAIFYKRKIFLWLASLLVVGAGLLTFVVQTNADSDWVQHNLILRRISQINLTHTTVQGRLLAWQQGIQAWQQRPIVGWGLENYSVAQNFNYQPSMEEVAVQETWFDRAHNVFVDNLVMTGLVGLLAYLGLLFAALVLAWRFIRNATSQWQRTVGLIVIGATLANIVFNFFAFDTITSLVYIVMLWALLSSQIGKEVKASSSWLWWILIPLVLVSSYFIAFRNIIANKTMSNAIVAYYKKDFSRSFQLVDKALAYDTFLNNQVRSKLFDLGYDAYEHAQANNSRSSIEPYLARTAELGKDTIITEPYSAFYYTRLLHLYVKLVAWDKEAYLQDGEGVLNTLIDMSPNRPASHLGGGHLYTMAEEYESAHKQYDEAIALHPSWGEPYYHKGIVELSQGKISEADEYFNQAQELGFKFVTFQNFNIIAGILENQGQLQPAEGYRMRIVNELPQEIQGHIELAKFYFRINNLDSAYKYLVEALKLEPEHQLARTLVVELNKINKKYVIPNI